MIDTTGRTGANAAAPAAAGAALADAAPGEATLLDGAGRLAARGVDGAGRLAARGVDGAALAALLLIALLPVVASGMPLAVVLVYLGLPATMLHQLAEHDEDLFRRSGNATTARAGGGTGVADVFLANVGAVRAAFVVSILAAALVDPGWGVFIACALLVNGTLHVLKEIGLRGDTPGLRTPILLFVPLGALQLATLWGVASGLQHAVGLCAAIAIHLAVGATGPRPAGATA